MPRRPGAHSSQQHSYRTFAMTLRASSVVKKLVTNRMAEAESKGRAADQVQSPKEKGRQHKPSASKRRMPVPLSTAMVTLASSLVLSSLLKSPPRLLPHTVLTRSNKGQRAPIYSKSYCMAKLH